MNNIIDYYRSIVTGITVDSFAKLLWDVFNIFWNSNKDVSSSEKARKLNAFMWLLNDPSEKYEPAFISKIESAIYRLRDHMSMQSSETREKWDSFAETCLYGKRDLSILAAKSIKKSGTQCFHVSRELVEVLAQTDVDYNILYGYHPPYNAFEIRIPEGAWTQDYVDMGYVRHLRSILVDRVENSKGETGWNFVLISGKEKQEEFDFIHQNFTQYVEGSHYDELTIDETVVKFVVNFLLYLNTSVDVEVVDSPVKMSQKKEFRIKEHSISKFTRVGWRTKFHYSESLKEFKASGSKQKPHIVRGHWRNQRFGEGRLQVKYIFIEPFIKGTGNIEDMGRSYKMQ